MALSRFPAAMNDAVRDVIEAGAGLRRLRDNQGDLTWADLSQVQSLLAQAKDSCIRAVQAAQIAPSDAEKYMVSMNGPATLQEFATLLGGIEQSAANWAAALGAWIAGLPAQDFRTIKHVPVGSVQSHLIVDTGFVPAARADALRASPELNGLIEAFNSVGA